jgi:hypothetical protein
VQKELNPTSVIDSCCVHLLFWLLFHFKYHSIKKSKNNIFFLYKFIEKTQRKSCLRLLKFKKKKKQTNEQLSSKKTIFIYKQKTTTTINITIFVISMMMTFG